MVSAYGYITVAELEAFAVTDYGTVDASYTDAVVEANISQAERLVNIYVGQTFTGTIPDGVVYVVLDVSFKLMHNRMVEEGIMDRQNPKKYFEDQLTKENKEILDVYIDKDLDNSADLIYMHPGRWYGW